MHRALLAGVHCSAQCQILLAEDCRAQKLGEILNLPEARDRPILLGRDDHNIFLKKYINARSEHARARIITVS